MKLPDLPINVVVRADSSGTSFVFTQHLSAISEEFGKAVGANTMPNWPVGTKSKGNEGVTASIMTTPGSIGYIEYGYAKSQKMPMAMLENKAGKFVAANTASGQAALASATLPDDMIAWASDPEGDGRLSDRHLHLADLLQEVPDKKQAPGDAGPGQVRPDRRAEGRRSARLHSAAGREWSRRRPPPSQTISARVARVGLDHVGQCYRITHRQPRCARQCSTLEPGEICASADTQSDR